MGVTYQTFSRDFPVVGSYRKKFCKRCKKELPANTTYRLRKTTDKREVFCEKCVGFTASRYSYVVFHSELNEKEKEFKRFFDRRWELKEEG